jgi:2-methylcitrate dehydratase PrpD
MERITQEKRLAEKIADFLVSKKYDDLPMETFEKIKEFALDVIGCTIGSSDQPQIKALTGVLSAEGGNSHAPVFAHSFKILGFNASIGATITTLKVIQKRFDSFLLALMPLRGL